jgi:hypothetical protein
MFISAMEILSPVLDPETQGDPTRAFDPPKFASLARFSAVAWLEKVGEAQQLHTLMLAPHRMSP